MSMFEILSNKFMLDDNKCPINNIKHTGLGEIHHMWKLSQLDKDIW